MGIDPSGRNGGAGGEGDPGLKRELEDALLELYKAYKAFAFYPPHHPALSHFLNNSWATIKKLGEARDLPLLKVTREGFLFHGNPLGKESPSVKALAAELHRRRIQGITFQGAVTVEEVASFLKVIAMDPTALEGEGGPRKRLLGEGVDHIRVEEFEHAKWLKSRVFSLQGEGGPGESGGRFEKGDFLVHEGVGQDIPHERAEAFDAGKGALAASEVEQTQPRILEDLISEAEAGIQALEGAGGLEEYRDIAEKLAEVSKKAIRRNRIDDFLKILLAFANHARPESPKPPELKECAAKEVEGILEGEELRLLIDRLCDKEGYREREIVELLLRKGKPAISPLLHRLAEEGEISARRRLISALIRFGEVAVPQVVEMLGDERWYVVRNMATILAEIGGEKEVPALGEALLHEDPRVRREALRALTRIKGQQAAGLILEALKDPDEAIRRQAIISVGVLREPRAITYLVGLIRRKGLGEAELSIKKEAVLALGTIGSDASVPQLAEILAKEHWFNRRRHNELRLSAVAALRNIGSKRALEAVRQGLNARSKEVRGACQSALAGVL